MAYAFNDDKSKVDLADVFASDYAYTNKEYSVNAGSVKAIRFYCPVNEIIVQINAIQFYIGNNAWAGSDKLEIVKMIWENNHIEVVVKNVTNSTVTVIQSTTGVESTFARVLVIRK